MEIIAIILSLHLLAEQSAGKMHGFLRRRFAAILAGICLLAPLHCRAETGAFVEVTTEITFEDWDYSILSDGGNGNAGKGPQESIFPKSVMRRCVVGADTWKIENDAGGRNGLTLVYRDQHY